MSSQDQRSQDQLMEWCNDPGPLLETAKNNRRDDGLHQCQLAHPEGRTGKYSVGNTWARASVALYGDRQAKFTSKEYETYEVDEGEIHIVGPDVEVLVRDS